jgi:hypothetical protein
MLGWVMSSIRANLDDGGGGSVYSSGSSIIGSVAPPPPPPPVGNCRRLMPPYPYEANGGDS